MDMHRTTMEIGLFETAVNLEAAGVSELPWQVGAAMPLPADNTSEKTEAVADWLLGFGKDKYLFLTPEIALIDSMARRAEKEVEAIIIVPCDMDAESQERLRHNLPKGTTVSIRQEPYFPEGFTPCNGLIAVCGYLAGGRAMVMSETYRLLEHYGGFHGRLAFIPYVTLEHFERCEGWRQTTSAFDEKWREN